MSTEPANLERVIELAKQLTPREKVRLIELLASTIESDLVAAQSGERKSLYGICSHLGPAPSAEDIDEVRREVWSGFPQGDV